MLSHFSFWPPFPLILRLTFTPRPPLPLTPLPRSEGLLLDKPFPLCDPPDPFSSVRVLSYSLGQRPRRHPGEDRVFADDERRLWSAAVAQHGQEYAIVFACITDARQPIRVLAMGDDAREADFTEQSLRAGLASAPRLGPLP